MLERHVASWAPTNYKQSEMSHINDGMKKKSQTIYDDKSAKVMSLFIYHCENFECFFVISRVHLFGIFDIVVTIFNGRTKYISRLVKNTKHFIGRAVHLRVFDLY